MNSCYDEFILFDMKVFDVKMEGLFVQLNLTKFGWDS